MLASAVLETAPLPLPPVATNLRWFSGRGCVEQSKGRTSVYVGGTLIGSYATDDVASRNAVIVGLAQAPSCHLGQLAEAFDLSSESVRQIRRLAEEEGLEAVLRRRRGGDRRSRLSDADRKRAEKLFEQGATIPAVRVALKERASTSTLTRLRLRWQAERAQSESDPTPPAAEQRQLALAAVGTSIEGRQSTGGEDVEPVIRSRAPSPEARRVRVQHLGTWLLVAGVHWLGLYERALEAGDGRVDDASLRICLDALIGALAIGEGCVEGVRRLETPSAPALLLASRAPCPTTVRRVLGRLASDGGAEALHLGMASDYVEAARSAADETGPVFYVDNHLRPYTGKHTVRRGWRMQDKRVRPGTSDYYLHDEDGRAVARVASPEHAHLTDFLTPIARKLREALPEENILLAFDRAGAFPQQMSELRDEGFEFVTYERKPYPTLPASAFEELQLGDEKLGVRDARMNQGKGRGRLRRIAVRTEDGYQVNLLAISARPAAELIAVMRGRWRQENAFKHGVERWGLNQLDGRVVRHYSPLAMVPNPARRRLDRALKLARAEEGRIRSELARLPADHSRRARLAESLQQVLKQQADLEAQRPNVPDRARLFTTELAGRLVHHTVEYKLFLDTVRIACANVESDFAAELGAHLRRPREAKKTLANLFAAPGTLTITSRAITVSLEPAGTKQEREALQRMLHEVNERRLHHPGDPERRPIRFRVAQV